MVENADQAAEIAHLEEKIAGLELEIRNQKSDFSKEREFFDKYKKTREDQLQLQREQLLNLELTSAAHVTLITQQHESAAAEAKLSLDRERHVASMYSECVQKCAREVGVKLADYQAGISAEKSSLEQALKRASKGVGRLKSDILKLREATTLEIVLLKEKLAQSDKARNELQVALAGMKKSMEESRKSKTDKVTAVHKVPVTSKITASTEPPDGGITLSKVMNDAPPSSVLSSCEACLLLKRLGPEVMTSSTGKVTTICDVPAPRQSEAWTALLDAVYGEFLSKNCDKRALLVARESSKNCDKKQSCPPRLLKRKAADTNTPCAVKRTKKTMNGRDSLNPLSRTIRPRRCMAYLTPGRILHRKRMVMLRNSQKP